ncbi:cupin domain-containing protein [Gloeobacter kilaueensis]|uniref:Cupin type-2 domain-containing protein n=1 Tax=Gloeobacter kilaueensis (strain ATCC BAA-2537 / CCAP 1431/1 / ULC 316 / JS1) TaxID=1183438 RepID=U5QL69_GLOK1|nr:cupin domain-containing protein [Gloeobacter kilaueensis]AGY58324.1 hypothetical protein GKIL_2078 [Gloeobacter kilaueensis JS1]
MQPVLNVSAAPVNRFIHGEYFECWMTELAEPLGSKSVGVNITRVPPGKAAFPLHHHHVNEEHFFILSGTGVLRFGDKTYPVGPNDYVLTPAGGPELAHQFVNTGDGDLVYLAMSSLLLPEVVGYPDSDKTSVRIATTGQESTRFFIRDSAKDGVGYWDGEDGQAVSALVQQARTDT